MTLMRRSIMTLYSGNLDIYSHQVRIVLAEKGVSVDILNVDPNHPSEDLLTLNPYNTLPTLVDRELVLYHSRVVMEYLDERFPHPPLLPVYPVSRAKSRLLMYRIERDWYSLYKIIVDEQQSEEVRNKARRDLKEGLLAIAPVFGEYPFFLSDDFSLVDCCITPLLWRLPALEIELPKQAKPILTYASRVFERDSFQASLCDAEREIREHHDL